ncbi:MAG: hypothetical protein R3F11_03090 [Verrucomicrobiales bacterium]
MASCNGLKQNQADNSQSNGYYQQGQAYDPYAQDSVQVTEYGGQTQQQQNPYGQYQGQQDYGKSNISSRSSRLPESLSATDLPAALSAAADL